MAVYNSTTHEIASNSLASGLVFAAYFEGSNTDPVLGSELSGNSNETGAGATGWSQTGTNRLSFDIPAGLNTDSGTMLCLVQRESSPGSFARFYEVQDTQLALMIPSNVSLRQVVETEASTFGTAIQAFNAAQDPHTYVSTWNRTEGRKKFSYDGVIETDTGLTWSTISLTGSLEVLNRAAGDRGLRSRIEYLMFWDRELSDAEIASIEADPYQIIQPVSAGNTTDIYINFESGGAAPTAPWTYNQPAFTSGTGVLVADLVDSENQATGYGLEIVTAFLANGNGAWGGTDSGDWQAATFNDVWYTANGGSSSFKITGLPAGADYTLELAGHNGNSRDTDFTVEGTTIEYNVSDTATTTPPVSFSGTVDPDGEIVVSLERSAADGQFYGYVNGAKLSITESTPVQSDTTVIIDHDVPSNIALKWGESYTVTVTEDSGSYTFDSVPLTPPAGWSFVNFSSAPTLSGNPAEPGSIYEALTNYAPLSNYTMLAGDQLAFQTTAGLTMNADTTFTKTGGSASIQAKVWKDATSEWTPEFTIQINDLGVPDVGDGGDSGGDTTAPTLSSITAYKTGFVSGFVSYSTNENNGTDYVYVSTNATETAATVKANGVQGTVTAVGLRSLILSGLSPETTYYVHVVHTDAAGNDSNVLSSSSFTTDAIPVASDTPSSNRKLVLRQVKIKTKKVTKKAVLSRIY